MLHVTRQRSRRSMVGTARCAVRVPLCNVEWPFADAAARRPYQFFPITLKICIHSSRHPRTKNHARVFKIFGMTSVVRVSPCRAKRCCIPEHNYVLREAQAPFHSIKIFFARRRAWRLRGRFTFAVLVSGSSRPRTRSIKSKSRSTTPRN